MFFVFFKESLLWETKTEVTKINVRFCLGNSPGVFLFFGRTFGPFPLQILIRQLLECLGDQRRDRNRVDLSPLTPTHTSPCLIFTRDTQEGRALAWPCPLNHWGVETEGTRSSFSASVLFSVSMWRAAHRLKMKGESFRWYVDSFTCRV